MTKRDQALLLLHAQHSWVSEEDLSAWIEYSNQTVFRNKILRPFHKARLIEYDETGHRLHISPLGAKDVEERILKSRST